MRWKTCRWRSDLSARQPLLRDRSPVEYGVVPFGQVRKGWPLVSAGENGFTIELVGEIANMVRLSAGTESLENELYRSSVKVVAGPGCEPDDRIPTSREFLLSNPSARRAGQWNQAEFVINPVTPRPTSSERSHARFVGFVSGKHFSFQIGRAHV